MYIVTCLPDCILDLALFPLYSVALVVWQVGGQFLLDGKPIVPKEFKRISGYVMQVNASQPLELLLNSMRFHNLGSSTR